ncbi:unnamed protein product [Penicillium salamii]|nr:unnamed protein product [Penicillium salamii]CAG8358975.1 unnamed protein product [Penicillium salamii]
MLLCGIIDELTQLFRDSANISFFFCQATDARINNTTAILCGLIYSLIKKHPSLLSHVKSQYDHARKALFKDINAWNALSRIFTNILKNATLLSTYLIIDALNECTTSLSPLLDLIAQPDIEERLNSTNTAPISLELNEASVSKAMSKFIQHKVHYLAKVKKYSDKTHHTIRLCQDLNRTSRRHAIRKLEAFPPRLNALYSRMIDQVYNSEDTKSCKRILAVMSIVYRPIAFNELASLVELPNNLADNSKALSDIIAICGSFLTMREDTIIFVHQSTKKFLLKETQTKVLPRGIEAEHYTLFSRSLKAMSKTLRRDIFQVKFPEFPIKKVDHLHHSGYHKKKDLDIDKREYISDFLQTRFLHWLEALSILRSISQGIAAILKLEGLLQENKEPPTLLEQVQDASQFIRYHKLAIKNYPLQVYSSPLVFSPISSLTRRYYQKERPNWVLNKPLVNKD